MVIVSGIATIEEVRTEEREAREKLKRVQKAQRGAERRRAQFRAVVIREELARPLARHCRCGITPQMTPAQLSAMGEGCTGGRGLGEPGYVCPTLDAVRRRLQVWRRIKEVDDAEA